MEATGINVTTSTGSDTDPDATNTSSSDSSNHQYDVPATPILLKDKQARWNAKVESLAGLEARGMTCVLPGLYGHLQMFALWFSINSVAKNIITGLLAPLVFRLGWVDCVCIVIFTSALTASVAFYISTFGPAPLLGWVSFGTKGLLL